MVLPNLNGDHQHGIVPFECNKNLSKSNITPIRMLTMFFGAVIKVSFSRTKPLFELGDMAEMVNFLHLRRTQLIDCFVFYMSGSERKTPGPFK